MSRSWHRPCRTALHSGRDEFPLWSWRNSTWAWFPGVSELCCASCGVRALNARRRGQERGQRACGCPRARRAPPEGVLSPRARRTLLEDQGSALERGGPRPRGRQGLERGGPHPRERLTLERRGPHSRSVPLCRPGRPRGPPGAWSCLVCVLGAWVDSWFAFFAGFKRVSPGYLGDPYGCPRHFEKS
jgi:hypothetical protein